MVKISGSDSIQIQNHITTAKESGVICLQSLPDIYTSHCRYFLDLWMKKTLKIISIYNLPKRGTVLPGVCGSQHCTWWHQGKSVQKVKNTLESMALDPDSNPVGSRTLWPGQMHFRNSLSDRVWPYSRIKKLKAFLWNDQICHMCRCHFVCRFSREWFEPGQYLVSRPSTLSSRWPSGFGCIASPRTRKLLLSGKLSYIFPGFRLYWKSPVVRSLLSTCLLPVLLGQLPVYYVYSRCRVPLSNREYIHGSTPGVTGSTPGVLMSTPGAILGLLPVHRVYSGCKHCKV